MKIMLLCSAFNGLSQRVWAELRAAGHEVRVQLAGEAEAMCAAVTDHQPDLIICPFLRERVPAQIWQAYRTIIIHPGPQGDRGRRRWTGRSLDGERELGRHRAAGRRGDGRGPIWGTRTFPVDPADPPRKSSLYNGPVADAAIELVHEVVAKAADPAFVPAPLGLPPPRGARPAAADDAPVRPRVLLVRPHRDDPAADPGRRRVAGRAHHAVRDCRGGVRRPSGTGARRRAGHGRCAGSHGAVLVRTGDGGVWIGQVAPGAATAGLKLPATMALARSAGRVPECAAAVDAAAVRYREIGYRRDGAGRGAELRLLQRRHVDRPVPTAGGGAARTPPPRTPGCWCSAAATGVLQRHPPQRHRRRAHPAIEAWRNIHAIDDVCREIITCTGQLVVASVARQRRRRRRDARARRRPGARPRRRRAQPALPDDGPLRLGVLDLRAAPPGRRGTGPSR